MRVGYVTSDAEQIGGELFFNGTGYYRCVLPASRLEANGHQTVVTNSIIQHPDGSLHPVLNDEHYDCDVVVLQRWMKYQAPEAILKARACGQTVINDIDDWFLGIPTSNQAFIATHPRFDRETQVLVTREAARAAGQGINTENRAHYFRGLANGSAITCSTEYLAERMRAHFDVPIMVLRNPIDLARFRRQEDVSDGPVVGWTGGIPWRGNDLHVLRGVLGPFLDRHDLRFVHGGHHRDAASHQFAAHQLGIDPARIELREIVPLERYRELWMDVDIAVIPLEDVPFNSAKSCLKGLEAGACGIPFIASASPEYRWLGAGLLARRPKHWIAHLERLMDAGERVRIGAECRARAELESIDVRWGEWEATYMAVADAKAAA